MFIEASPWPAKHCRQAGHPLYSRAYSPLVVLLMYNRFISEKPYNLKGRVACWQWLDGDLNFCVVFLNRCIVVRAMDMIAFGRLRVRTARTQKIPLVCMGHHLAIETMPWTN
jgi:hypothetical protein